jgi:uncharacterized protein (DUF433 family)
MAMIPAPLGFFEMQRELVGADATLFGQPGFGKAPEGFDAVVVFFRPIAFSAVFVQSNPMTFKRITCDPKRMNGQPCVRQLCLTVRRVVEAVATYPDRRDLQREFPELEAEDIREALAYAAAN